MCEGNLKLRSKCFKEREQKNTSKEDGKCEAREVEK